MSLQESFGMPHMLAIGSGKGGTGKTLVAVSLAQALAQAGEKVLLCDADLGLSNAAVHLGLASGGDLAGVLSGKRKLADAIQPFLGGAATRRGFDLLAAPAGSGALARAGEAGARRLALTLRYAAQYDRILLDLGAGVDGLVMTFATAADRALLVMTPDPASLTDAYAFTKLYAAALPGHVPSLVVNMASEAEGRRTADGLIAVAKTYLKVTPDYLGSVPRDPRVQDAVRRQCQLLTQSPQSPAARALETVAHKLTAKRPQAARSVKVS